MAQQPPAPKLFSKPSRFLPEGSAAWLIRHHIRTRLRGKGPRSHVQTWVRNIVLLSFFCLTIATIGKSIAQSLALIDSIDHNNTAVVKAGITLIAFIISLLGSSLISAYSIFTDRDDLDLLLSSPLPPQRVLMARMLQTAYSAFLTATFMGVITYGYAIVTVNFAFVLIFPVLFSLMIVNLALSFLLARALLLTFGLRRGRTIAMGLGFVILIGGVLCFQFNSLLGTRSGQKLLLETLGAQNVSNIKMLAGYVGILALGQLWQTLALVCVAGTSFAAVAAFFWNRFAGDAAYMAGQAQHMPRPKAVSRLRFGQGLYRVAIAKEWRSMSRDPLVLTQVATPLVSLIPMGIGIYVFNQSEAELPDWLNTGLFGLLLVQFGSQITGTLAWTAASIEEAGDLLMSSPADDGHLFWSKALATAIPSFGFLLLGMTGVAVFDLRAALGGLLVGSIGLSCAGAIEFLRPRPARRAKMTQRPDRSIVSVLLGLLFSLNWGVATALVMWGFGLWSGLPIALGLMALVFVWVTSPAFQARRKAKRNVTPLTTQQVSQTQAIGI